MRKVLTIAASEFQTAVRAKGFWIGILFMPVLFGGALQLQKVVDRQVDARPRTIAVVDDTGELAPALQVAVDAWNRGERDQGPAVAGGPQFRVETVAPGDREREALRLELSERVRREELFAFAELPADLLAPATTARIRYYSAAPAYGELPGWLHRSVMKEVITRRFADADVSPMVVHNLIRPLGMEELGLLDRSRDGRIQPAQTVDKVRTIGVPVTFMFVLFIIVMTTTPQLLNSVLEEKMSRISEVLLGSVTPFQLMLGKLVASTSVSAVLTIVYLTGAAFAAQRWGYLDAIDPRMLVWFVIFLLMAVTLYGSLFIAIGSACSDLKDAQNLMTPAMMLIMIPALMWPAITRAPQSMLSVGASLFPPATPFLMLLRLALEERPPAWQVGLSVLLTLLTTMLIVWAAGKIVRTGLLMQGKGVGFRELVRWVRA
jgi:ABC-2 type transport system permease protein